MFEVVKSWWLKRTRRLLITSLRRRWRAFYHPLPFDSDVAVGRQILDFMELADAYIRETHPEIWCEKRLRNGVILTAVSIELQREPADVMALARLGAFPAGD